MAAPSDRKSSMDRSAILADSLWNRRMISPPPTLTCCYTTKEADEVGQKQYCKLLSEMTPTLEHIDQVLASEQFTMARLLFKCHNQQRRWKWYQLIAKINKTLQRLQDVNLKTWMTKLTECCYQGRSSSSVTTWHMCSLQMHQYLHVRFIGLAKLCSYIATLCEQIALFLVQFLGHGHMIINNVVFCAIISRIWVLIQAYLSHIIRWYDQLYPWCKKLKAMPTDWLPADEHLPESLSVWLESENLHGNLQNSRTKRTKSQTLLSKWFSDQAGGSTTEAHILEDSIKLDGASAVDLDIKLDGASTVDLGIKLDGVPTVDLGELITDRTKFTTMDSEGQSNTFNKKTELNNNEFEIDSQDTMDSPVQIIEASHMKRISPHEAGGSEIEKSQKSKKKKKRKCKESDVTEPSHVIDLTNLTNTESESSVTEIEPVLKKQKRKSIASNKHETGQSHIRDQDNQTESESQLYVKQIEQVSKKKRRKNIDDSQTEQPHIIDLSNLTESDSQLSVKETEPVPKKKKKRNHIRDISMTDSEVIAMDEDISKLPHNTKNVENERTENQITCVEHMSDNYEDGVGVSQDTAAIPLSTGKAKKKKKKKKKHKLNTLMQDKTNIGSDFAVSIDPTKESSTVKTVEFSPETVHKIETQIIKSDINVAKDDNILPIDTKNTVSKKKKKKKRKLNPLMQDNTNVGCNSFVSTNPTIESSTAKDVELSPKTVYMIEKEIIKRDINVATEDTISTSQTENIVSKKKRRKLNSLMQNNTDTSCNSVVYMSPAIKTVELSPETVHNIETEIIKSDINVATDDNILPTQTENIVSKKKRKKKRKLNPLMQDNTNVSSDSILYIDPTKQSSTTKTVELSPETVHKIETEIINSVTAEDTISPNQTENIVSKKKKKKKHKKKVTLSVIEDNNKPFDINSDMEATKNQTKEIEVAMSDWYQSTQQNEEPNQAPQTKNKKRKKRPCDPAPPDQIQQNDEGASENFSIDVESNQVDESDVVVKKKRKKKKKHESDASKSSMVCDLGQLKQHSKKKKLISEADIDDIFSALQF